MSAPPWLALKKKPKVVEITASADWEVPSQLHLEKHVRFYRDLLRSTEKVELSLAHSGKEEVFDVYGDPNEPGRGTFDYSKHRVILVPLRGDMDPRLEFLREDGAVDTRPEYKDLDYLRRLLEQRAQYVTPGASKSATPMGSPIGSRHPSPPIPMAPAGAPRPPPPNRPPPPPKAGAPGDFTKRQKVSLDWVNNGQ